MLIVYLKREIYHNNHPGFLPSACLRPCGLEIWSLVRKISIYLSVYLSIFVDAYRERSLCFKLSLNWRQVFLLSENKVKNSKFDVTAWTKWTGFSYLFCLFTFTVQYFLALCMEFPSVKTVLPIWRQNDAEAEDSVWTFKLCFVTIILA